MKCSNCSEVVKPVVAIDIDGTLADYHGAFLDFANEYVGGRGGSGDHGTMYELIDYDGRASFRDWVCERLEIDVTTWRQIKLAYRQGGQKRSLPIYDGATDLCAAVRAAGAELWLTTTRPFLRLDGIDPDTREWLRRHEIGYDGLLYDEDKYRVLGERVDRERVVAVLDDLPEMVEEARRYFGWKVPLFRGSTWNRGVAGDRVSLAEAQVEIISRVEVWR